jgi:hypothetical protein
MDASSVLVKRLEGMKETRRRELLTLLDEFAQGLPGSEKLYLRPEPETRGESTVSGSEQVTSTGKARKP